MSWTPESYRKYERLVMERKRRLAAPLDWLQNVISSIVDPDAPTSIAPGALPSLAGDVTGAIGANTVEAIRGVVVSATPPTIGQVLTAIDADSAEWDDATAGSALTVQELDGSPLDSAVTIIRVTNGKLTDNGAGDVTLDLSGNPLTVQEVDGSPTETPTTTLQFPNGTLTEPVAGTVRYTPAADADEKAKVSANDTTPGYLNGKLVAGAGVTLTENNDGGNETLTLAATGTGRYRAWTYTTFAAGEFTYVVDLDGNPVYSLQELE